jgi:hypothetical protein
VIRRPPNRFANLTDRHQAYQRRLAEFFEKRRFRFPSGIALTLAVFLQKR